MIWYKGRWKIEIKIVQIKFNKNGVFNLSNFNLKLKLKNLMLKYWWEEEEVPTWKAEDAVPNIKPFGKSALCICDIHIGIWNDAITAKTRKMTLEAMDRLDDGEWERNNKILFVCNKFEIGLLSLLWSIFIEEMKEGKCKAKIYYGKWEWEGECERGKVLHMPTI